MQSMKYFNMDSEELNMVKREGMGKTQHECVACGKYVSDKRNLMRHLRNIHCIEPIVRTPRLKCSFNEDCTFVGATSGILREHLQEVHNFNVVKKILNFKSRADFEKWKLEEEQSTNARYVYYTGTKHRGSRKIYYLKCHRSGAVKGDGHANERKRSKPMKGYTRCGAICPSTLKVAETANGNIQVMYFPAHLGHSLDDESVPYIKLSAKEKEKIVGKLAQGEPVEKIVSDARKTTGNKLTRINLLQSRDVYNIKKRIVYLEKESDQDGRDIDSWVKALNAEGLTRSPVALYIPGGDGRDYCLILVHHVQKAVYSAAFDGSIVYVKTKRGKANVDPCVVCLSVACDNGDGYPIAFCVSPKTEYLTMYTFFKVVHQNFGMIKSRTFVSDSIRQYYHAWRNVMGKCENKLLCSFNMDYYWERKLTALNCPVGKLKATMAELRLLLQQPDKDVFESELSKTYQNWKTDEKMELFASFFQKFYLKNRFEWATCYRIHSTRKESINKYLEPIHTVLDAIYVESYKSVRNALKSLLLFVRDFCLLKLLSFDEHAAGEKALSTARNHEGVRRTSGVRRSSGSDWVVTEDGSEFAVKKEESECDKKCGIYCESCDICVHEYICGCSDYVVEFNICRHMHAVGISMRETEPEKFKNLGALTSKHFAMEKAKSLATRLEMSNLCEEEYNRIGATLSRLDSVF